jgi:hypothetical protein
VKNRNEGAFEYSPNTPLHLHLLDDESLLNVAVNDLAFAAFLCFCLGAPCLA